MYTKTIKACINQGQNVSRKAKDDYFFPVTGVSSQFKNWVAILDFKTCATCRSNHGKVFYNYEDVDPEPPVHEKCRCNISPLKSVAAGSATKDNLNGADFWLKYTGRLPENYISWEQLQSLGWKRGERPSKYSSGKMLGGMLYYYADGHLPNGSGRVWHEADINYTHGRRNTHRIVWSNDGLIFVTYDHYQTFYEII